MASALENEQQESCLVDRESISIPPQGFTYTSCYCEENVYLLCRTLVARGVADVDDLAVVFISNADRKVPLWCQRAGMRRPEGGSRRRGRDGEEQGLVVWDYHVVCVHVKHGSPCSARAGSDGSGCSEWFVWDLDTTLAFPTPASEYVQRALWAGRSFFLPLQDTYQRLYRVVSASNFFKLFASDRSHMRDTVTRNWIASPPSYPCITAEDGETNRLESYIQMSPVDTVDIGVICKDYTSRGSLSSLNLLSWKTLLSAHNFGVLLDEVGFCLLLGETR